MIVRPKRNKNKDITFKDHPEFRPNRTPREIFKSGSFGGTYWREIHSATTKKTYKNCHRVFPKSWWRGIPEEWMTKHFDEYDASINKYGVRVGTTLRYWEEKKWITSYDPYGWVQWYCNFYMGRRCEDDDRQIKRWLRLAGPTGRFRKALEGMISRKNARKNDYSISPKIRQTLLHWAYEISN